MRPCPFCGASGSRLELQGDRAARWVHCWTCGANGPTAGPSGPPKQDVRAVTLWDTALRSAPAGKGGQP